MVGPRLASDQGAGAALRTACGAVIVSGRVGHCERLWQWPDPEHLFWLTWWGSLLKRAQQVAQQAIHSHTPDARPLSGAGQPGDR
jgi:hypothetical protein